MMSQSSTSQSQSSTSNSNNSNLLLKIKITNDNQVYEPVQLNVDVKSGKNAGDLLDYLHMKILGHITEYFNSYGSVTSEYLADFHGEELLAEIHGRKCRLVIHTTYTRIHTKKGEAVKEEELAIYCEEVNEDDHEEAFFFNAPVKLIDYLKRKYNNFLSFL